MITQADIEEAIRPHRVVGTWCEGCRSHVVGWAKHIASIIAELNGL